MSERGEIRVRDNPTARQYEVTIDDEVALVAYSLDGDTVTFTHTEVPTRFEGQGVGGAIVRFALDDARRRALRVIPMCPFVRAWLKRHAEYLDIVHPDWRHALER